MGQFFEDPLDRVDGRLKVTGAARYFAEYDLPDMTFAVMATSAITRGKILTIDTKSAERAPGVLDVLTYLNMPSIPGWQSDPSKPAPQAALGGERYRVLGSDQILFNGQPIALVVADSLERAQYAASLIKATYQKASFETDLEKNKDKGQTVRGPRGADYNRGDANAYKTAAVQLEQEYTIPIETHNPMELHGIIASWKGNDSITVYAKTQGVKSTQQSLMNAFKLDQKNVQVFSEFVGGGFGMALRTWPQEILVAAAAKKIGRPVKLVMSRDQMFTMVGYRPFSIQQIKLGSTKEGQLTGLVHEALSQTSSYEDFAEGTVNMSKFMYACDNVATKYRIVPLDIGVPIWMRGPGEATGAFALETAMDEMAYKLNMDPIALRLKNYTETDPERNRPYSSKYVKEAYQLGAEKIGWFKRNPAPRSMKDGEWLVGYGMSSGVFNASRGEANCRAVVKDDGTLLLQSAASDIGPGTGTAMVQIAHEVLGYPVDKISFELGNSTFPPAPSQGGSTTTSTVGSAVHIACSSLKNKIVNLLLEKGGSDYAGKTAADFTFSDGNVRAGNVSVSIASLLKQQNLPALEVTENSKAGPDQQKYSMYSFSIHFAEVRVHPKTGVVRVKRVVTVADSGKIISPKTAASQMIGGVTGGIGMALMEESVIDHRYGRFINNNFADYHVPVSADIPHIDTIFIDKPDPVINPMGAKGMGEIALIGFAAAVGNAVYHATGKRIRELPITPDKLIE
ncbi:MAG: aldehyde oxidase and xanthine dehydrogenase molybdopterin binding [Ferruginibacter sp.]|nr:aldehyde oxidase and xanthine dehydrogenase molybdopterin binding [Ferruginibacter sp.]